MLDAVPNTLISRLVPGVAVDARVDGPAGRIEAVIAAPKDEIRGLCVVCHPHPLFGGSMVHKVVWTLASAALKAGLLVARFNFRGVGRSEGQYDEGIGETDDTLAVIDYLVVLGMHLPANAASTASAEGPSQPLPIVVTGFSFGGHIAVRAAGRLPSPPAALVTIAPPFGPRYLKADERLPHPRCPWLAVHSRDDEIVSFAETQAALRTYDPPPSFVQFDGAGHFFHGRLGELQAAVQPFLVTACEDARDSFAAAARPTIQNPA